MNRREEAEDITMCIYRIYDTWTVTIHENSNKNSTCRLPYKSTRFSSSSSVFLLRKLRFYCQKGICPFASCRALVHRCKDGSWCGSNFASNSEGCCSIDVFFWKFVVPWVFMSFHDFPWCSRCDCHLSLAPVPTIRHHGASSENSGAPCNLRWVSLLFPRTESLYSEKQAMDAFLEIIWVCLKMRYTVVYTSKYSF